MYILFPCGNSIADDKHTLEKAIGHILIYETEIRLDGSIGINSALTEVFKTYYDQVESLDKNDRAMFLFIADSQLQVHGGSDLFHFYDFVYLCCFNEYVQLYKR